MNKRFITSIILIGIIVAGMTSCEKEDTKPVETTVSTTVTEITETTAAETTVEDVKLEKTATPTIVGQTNTSPEIICVAGRCESNSEITIRGGKEKVSFKSDYEYFIGTVEVLHDAGQVTLTLTAKAEGKAESDEIELTCEYKENFTGLRDDDYEVIVGLDSQCHFVTALEDYEGTNLLKDKQIEKIKESIKKNVEWINSNMSDTELIYMIIPDSMTVYPETVPKTYKKADGTTRVKQFIEAAKAGGATVIDTTDTLIAHKSDELKLFHKTDSHWTDYGAWLAYTDLMNHIAKKYPDAAPRTYDDMGFYLKDVNGGDMPYYLDFACEDVREMAVFAKPTVEFPTNTPKFRSDEDLLMNHDTTPKSAVKRTNRDNLPSAYVMRDSYGIALYDMLVDRFNTTTYKIMWTYDFAKDTIKQNGADYIIYVISERDLGDLIEQLY